VNRLVALAILVCAALATSGARAQKNDAQTHFNEGMKLFAKGDYDGACAAFEKSEKVGKPTMASSFQLGRCNEGREKYGLAFEYYERAARLGDQSGDPERATIARQRAQDAGAKAPKLVFHVAAERRVDRMRIELDGEAVDDEDWGKPIPVAERPHRVVVTAPGKKSATLQLPAPETGKTTKVDIPKLSPGSGSAEPTPPPTAKPGAPAPATGPRPALPPGYGQPIEMERRNTGLFATGIVFICLGGLGIVVGGIWTAGTALVDEVAIPAVVTLIGGVALLGTGIPLVVIFGKKVPPSEPAAGVRVEPILGPTSGGLRVTF
jgi:hypothetical protein